MRKRSAIIAALLATAALCSPARAQIFLQGPTQVTNTPGAVNSVSSGDSFVVVAPNTGNVTISLASGLLRASNNLSDVNSAATARSNLGLGSMAQQASTAVAITGGSIGGVAITTSTLNGITFVGSGTLNIGPAGTLTSAAFTSIGTSGATIPLLNADNTYGGPARFGGGDPWVDVTAFGCKYDSNTTDNSTCIQNAIDYIESNTHGFVSGIVYFPSGNGGFMCARSGVTVRNLGTRLVGASKEYSNIAACTGDTVVVTLQGGFEGIENMTIYGTNSPGLTSAPMGPAVTNQPSAGGTFGASHPALLLTGGSLQLLNIEVNGGYYAIQNQGDDSTFINIEASSPFGTANFYNTASFWLTRAKLDGQYPTGALPPHTTSIPAWTQGTSYTANDLVTLPAGGLGTVWIQALTTGTSCSPSSGPTLKNYNETMTDCGVTWGFAGNSNHGAMVLDSGSTEVYIDQADLSGPYGAGLIVSNQLLTGNGVYLKCHECLASGITAGFLVQSGADVYLDQVHTAAPVLSTGANLAVDTTFTGSLSVHNGQFVSTLSDGATIKGGGSVQLIGNVIKGAGGHEALFVSGHTATVIADNILGGTGSGFVVNDTVAATDHVAVHDNTCLSGVSPCGSYTASGANSKIHDNIGYNPVGVSGPVTVGASPATICAGPSPEVHYFTQSATNTATITIGGKNIGTLSAAGVVRIADLAPNQCEVVTWATTAPTYIKDVH